MGLSIRKHVFPLAVTGMLGALAVPARGGFTDAAGTAKVRSDQAAILGSLYGGTFKADNQGYTNGTIRALRVEDFNASNAPLSVSGLPGPAGPVSSDRFFSNGDFSARAVASNRQNDVSYSFGLLPGTKDIAGETASYTKLFDVTGRGGVGDVAGDVSQSDRSGQSWRWAVQANYADGSAATYTSRAEDNADGKDHFATYLIEGLNKGSSSGATWALFFEDMDSTRAAASQSKRVSDFDDLVVEVRSPAGKGADLSGSATGSAGGVAVPLPPAVYSGAALLAGIGAIRLRRRFASA